MKYRSLEKQLEYTADVDDRKPALQLAVEAQKTLRFNLYVDILKDLFDFPCAMEGALKRNNFHNGFTGLFAVVSSAAGLYLAYPRT